MMFIIAKMCFQGYEMMPNLLTMSDNDMFSVTKLPIFSSMSITCCQ